MHIYNQFYCQKKNQHGNNALFRYIGHILNFGDLNFDLFRTKTADPWFKL